MEPIDYVEPWMLVSASADSKGDFLRGLLCGTFWFPVEYHPELGDPFEPGLNDEIPFWIAENAEGKFIPIFTSPDVMQIVLEHFDHRHSRGRMRGSDLIEALGRNYYPVIINPGAKISTTLPAAGVRMLATGMANIRKRGARKKRVTKKGARKKGGKP